MSTGRALIRIAVVLPTAIAVIVWVFTDAAT